MRPTELTTFLATTIKAGLPVCIVSGPGLGKSDIVSQVTASLGYDLILSHPAVEDPTDAKGIPWGGSDGTIDFRPVGQIKKVLAATKPTVWFLDDFGQASPATQASYMQWLLARECAGHVLPSCVVIVVATNRRTDRAGVSGILEPVKSRFAAIVELEANIDDFCTWAFTQEHFTAEDVAFLRFKTDLFNAFAPSADLTNSPTPRTWSNAAKIMQLGLSPALELAGVAGAVGEGAASERMAFRRMYADLPAIDGILLDPESSDIPKSPATLYAVVTTLGIRATPKNFGRIARYAERLTEASHGEFAALLLRDAVRRDPAIMQTSAFVKLASGELGQLIAGN